LMLVQLAIMYVWAAISKMDPAWVDGRTLAGQIAGPLRTLIDHTVNIRRAAQMVIAVELALAATVWIKRAWRLAAPLGIIFHVGIIASKLEIGRFAFLMLAIYIFIVPDRIWTWCARIVPARLATARFPARLAWPLAIAGTAAG